MKKIILLIAAVSFVASSSAFAQKIVQEDDKTCTVVEETETPEGKVVTTTVYEKNRVLTNGFWHNWTLGGAIGAQLYYGDNDWKVANWTEMITCPALDFYLTKWASPCFGVGIGLSGFQFKGLYQSADTRMDAHFKTGDLYKDAAPVYDYEVLARQKGNYFNAYALAHADLGNIFFGYKPDRFFDIDAYAGGGIAYGFGDDYNFPGATFNLGLANLFRLSNRLQLMVNVRGAFIDDDFDGEAYVKEPTMKHVKANHKLDGNFGITAGLNWKLGKEKSGWELASRVSEVRYNDKDAAAAEARANELAKQLADAQNANGDLQNMIKELQSHHYLKEIPECWFHINFVIDKWEIVKREMINLQSVSELIKSTPSVKYLICGYADKQTATPEHNVMLSKNRVEAVYNALVNELGVDPAQLVTDYKGGVDYMFYNQPEFSRCVMINPIKD